MNDGGIHTRWRQGRMSSCGYEQTLERPSFGVRFGAGTRRRTPNLRESERRRPLPSGERTSQRLALDVCL